MVYPCLDGVEPVAEFIYSEAGGPKIVGESFEGCRVPFGFTAMPIQYSPRDMVMTVAEDRCGYMDYISEDSLCRIAAAVDLRLNLFDNDTPPAFNRFHITRSSDRTLLSHGIPASALCVRPSELEERSLLRKMHTRAQAFAGRTQAKGCGPRFGERG